MTLEYTENGALLSFTMVYWSLAYSIYLLVTIPAATATAATRLHLRRFCCVAASVAVAVAVAVAFVVFCSVVAVLMLRKFACFCS